MRVLIVADNTLAAEGIRREMRYASSCRVIGFVNGRRPCAAIVAGDDPDAVLLDDMRSPDVTLERIAELRLALPATKLVLITLRTEPAWLSQAAAAGIDAVVCKVAKPGALGTLVREVVNGNVFHAFAVNREIVADSPRRHSLTTRELEILRLAASGSSNGRIAKRLWITEQTVKFHLSNVYRKLGVANRTQASHFAHTHGLVGDPTPRPDTQAAA